MDQDLTVAAVAVVSLIVGAYLGTCAVQYDWRGALREQTQIADAWRSEAMKQGRRADRLSAELAKLREMQRQAGERGEMLAILGDGPGAERVEATG